ncbi:MAG: rRNA pseudouridine synthase [Verrucomicrobiae bacterium]|nr:rRNA pseudouridine synthase [Verrucomicrobiae bacterium]
MPQGSHLRLNQFLASAGLGSRRSCERLIRDGLVWVNGKKITSLATRVKSQDQVICDGKEVRLKQEKIVIAFNKPRGFVCSKKSEGSFRSIYDLLPVEFKSLFYVGRLDAESEGLLLLTNDGYLAQQFSHPRYHVSKIYRATLDKAFDFQKSTRLLKGSWVEGKRAKFDAIHALSGKTVKVILSQGIKRQIRQQFFQLGYEVKKLVRTQVGPILLDHLPAGKWRKLNLEELKKLKKSFN